MGTDTSHALKTASVGRRETNELGAGSGFSSAFAAFDTICLNLDVCPFL